MKKMGRPLDGKENKKVYSIRLEPKIYNKLVKKYGSFAVAVKELLKKRE